MDILKIHEYKSAFDQIAKSVKDDDGNSVEVCYARELQPQLGYARWENFVVAIGRAIKSCKTLVISVDDHFREVTKMIPLGSGSERPIQDFMLTRYAWPTGYQARRTFASRRHQESGAACGKGRKRDAERVANCQRSKTKNEVSSTKTIPGSIDGSSSLSLRMASC